MVSEAPTIPALQARLYGEKLGDYQVVSGWWEDRHGEPLAETILPPLGVIIEDGQGPCAALWCYECFGVGVCFLEFPISRPKLSFGSAMQAFEMAVEGCIRVAKLHGDFSIFQGYTLPAIARALRSIGFVSGETGWTKIMLRRD